jgi:hypothetical protein
MHRSKTSLLIDQLVGTGAGHIDVLVRQDQQAAERAMLLVLVPSLISSSGWRTCARPLIAQ